jgi:uncharacterized protein
MRILNEEMLRNIVMGAGLLGSGGGGSTKEGMKLVDRVLEFSDGVQLIQPNEAKDTDWGAVIAGMGSPIASLTRVRTWSPKWALELLEKEVGFTSSFVIPFELGAGNSLNPMLAAVQKNIPMIDGDPCGRAVPQVDMTTFFLGGLSINPFTLTTEDGIKVLLQTKTPSDIERIARAITSELEGVSATSCHAMSGADLKKYIIPGTTTLVENLGATIRQHQAQGKDPSEAIVEKFDGYILGKGKVENIRVETRGGFDLGVVEVIGDLPLTVTFQNENMTAFRDNRLVAVVPDLICAIQDDGTPLTNADIKPGMQLTYLGFKAPEQFRSAEVFTLFKPILSALGYSDSFIPIEDLLK